MELSYAKLASLTQSERINEVSARQMLAFIEQDKVKSLPDGFIQRDPRSEMPVAYNLARAKRPHDYAETASTQGNQQDACVICSGKSTGIVDVMPLSSGYTFINKNLFPMVYPQNAGELTVPFAEKICGVHFLQWTSTNHDLDWHNMPVSDLSIVVERLADLALWGINEGAKLLSMNRPPFITIGKNYGPLVGGSLVHGHQQIGFTSVETLSEQQHKAFFAEKGLPFQEFILEKNPDLLTIRKYSTARLIVPYFMARPYNMLLLLEDSSKKQLHELSAQECMDISWGWQDAIRLIRWIMPGIGKELAYNVVGHVGRHKGVYFEFLPYTQETGCFEHAGLYICQSNPQTCAENLKTGLEYL